MSSPTGGRAGTGVHNAVSPLAVSVPRKVRWLRSRGCVTHVNWRCGSGCGRCGWSRRRASGTWARRCRPPSRWPPCSPRPGPAWTGWSRQEARRPRRAAHPLDSRLRARRPQEQLRLSRPLPPRPVRPKNSVYGGCRRHHVTGAAPSSGSRMPVCDHQANSDWWSWSVNASLGMRSGPRKIAPRAMRTWPWPASEAA